MRFDLDETLLLTSSSIFGLIHQRSHSFHHLPATRVIHVLVEEQL